MPDGAPHADPAAPLLDSLARPLRDLRISVTDRCNFRCTYCMPREAFGRDHAFLPRAALLDFDEITRVARVMMGLGVRKLRLTGGEPLLRKGLDHLVARLSALRTLEGQPPDIAMTTNGALLRAQARALREAGLARVTVSLDALDEARFQAITDSNTTVREVLAGIEAAQQAGFERIKVNMVVQRGRNEADILPMAQHFRGSGIELRFIEFMDVGQSNRWRHDAVVPSDEVRAMIDRVHPLHHVPADAPGSTSDRWRYVDGQGHVAFISSVSVPFCGDCTRLRLSTDGRLYTCLFAEHGHDLRALLRDPGCDDVAITRRLVALWHQRGDRYSEQRATTRGVSAASRQRVEMSFIGG